MKLHEFQEMVKAERKAQAQANAQKVMSVANATISTKEKEGKN